MPPLSNDRSPKNKSSQLKTIEEKLQALRVSPLYEYRKDNGFTPVFGEGNPNARIMLIGEAPGAKEAQTGRPFVGRAGQFLDSLLNAIDLEREDVYITNIVKDRPPGNRIPRAAEINSYAPFLLQQISVIQPDVIATLGRFAMEFILKQFDLPKQNQKISELHGQLLKAKLDYGEVKIIPLYHPAAVFYNRTLESEIKQDFQKLQKFS